MGRVYSKSRENIVIKHFLLLFLVSVLKDIRKWSKKRSKRKKIPPPTLSLIVARSVLALADRRTYGLSAVLCQYLEQTVITGRGSYDNLYINWIHYFKYLNEKIMIVITNV